jgi:hypothetical protein
MINAIQIIDIDDSGDAGFQFRRLSSKYFSIACIVFDDCLDAEEMILKIKRLRGSLGWPNYREFKFHKSSSAVRRMFLNEVQSGNFKVWAILADKTKITDPLLEKNSGRFYNFIIKEVLNRHREEIENADICIDGKAKKTYKQIAVAYFRTHINSDRKRIRRIRFVDSRKDDLIQLADMVVGALQRSRQSGLQRLLRHH